MQDHQIRAIIFLSLSLIVLLGGVATATEEPPIRLKKLTQRHRKIPTLDVPKDGCVVGVRGHMRASGDKLYWTASGKVIVLSLLEGQWRPFATFPSDDSSYIMPTDVVLIDHYIIESGYRDNSWGTKVSSFSVVDLTNPQKPLVVATYEFEGDVTITEIKARGSTLYMAGGSAGVLVIDMQNVRQPKMTVRLPPNGGMSVSAVDLFGDYLFVGHDQARGGEPGFFAGIFQFLTSARPHKLSMYSIKNPTHPTRINHTSYGDEIINWVSKISAGDGWLAVRNQYSGELGAIYFFSFDGKGLHRSTTSRKTVLNIQSMHTVGPNQLVISLTNGSYLFAEVSKRNPGPKVIARLPANPTPDYSVYNNEMAHIGTTLIRDGYKSGKEMIDFSNFKKPRWLPRLQDCGE